ncbi:hypothetical protein GCM10010216_70790 [Streptomyces flaveolus]|nr:hypothetical protein GCM10010216_70790 [Streptomyces flaveolus]
MSASRPESTACPIPAEASTTTDSAVTARTAQRGLLRRTAGTGGRREGRGRVRCGGGPPCGGDAGTLGERGGVGKVTPPRGRNLGAGRGIREHRRPIRSADRGRDPRGAHPCPPFAVT